MAPLNCTICSEPTNVMVTGDLMSEPYTAIYSDRCNSCRLTASYALWAAAPSWRHLLRYNIFYLRSGIHCSPNFGIGLNPESTPLVPHLTKLHDYGILTTNSLPYCDSTTYKIGYGWFQLQQRSYVNFLIPTTHEKMTRDRVDKLVSALLAHDILVATAYSECDAYPERSGGNAHRRVSPITLPQKDKLGLYDFRTSASEEMFLVTRFRAASTSPVLRAKEWTQQSWFSVTSADDTSVHNHSCGFAGDGKAFAEVERMRPLAVEVMVKEWRREMDLLAVVESLCRSVKLVGVFEGVGDEDAGMGGL